MSYTPLRICRAGYSSISYLSRRMCVLSLGHGQGAPEFLSGCAFPSVGRPDATETVEPHRQPRDLRLLFVEILGVSQPKISRHLAYLRRAGIVASRRDGKWMHYRLSMPKDEAAASLLRETLKHLAVKAGDATRHRQARLGVLQARKVRATSRRTTTASNRSISYVALIQPTETRHQRSPTARIPPIATNLAATRRVYTRRRRDGHKNSRVFRRRQHPP